MFALTPIPTIGPLFGRAVVLAGIADSTGENDIVEFMPSALIDGDDMIDGERIGIMLLLAVRADTRLPDAHSREFLLCEVAPVAFNTGAALLAGRTKQIEIGVAIGADMICMGRSPCAQ